MGKDMEMLIFGDSGAPVVAFPTSTGNYLEWEENGLIDILAEQIHLGYNQIFCVDSVMNKSLINKEIAPENRLTTQLQYECYILEEVLPFIKENNEHFYIMSAGIELGAYHSLLFALKHPEEFNKTICISGDYDIRKYLDEYYDDTVYYNNPVDFIPNLNDPNILNQIENLDIRLVSYSSDPYRETTERMSQTLWMKMIEHRLDIWDLNTPGKLELWGEMLKTHII